jgi:hypothetical protein
MYVTVPSRHLIAQFLVHLIIKQYKCSSLHLRIKQLNVAR